MVGSVITNSLAWLKDRRASRADVVRLIEKILVRAQLAGQTEVTGTVDLFESLADFQAAALLAGVPRRPVSLVYRLCLGLASRDADDETVDAAHEVAYWLAGTMWHPVRSRFTFRRRRKLKKIEVEIEDRWQKRQAHGEVELPNASQV